MMTIPAVMAVLVLTTMPCHTMLAGETADSLKTITTVQQQQASSSKKGLTVKGRRATPKEKAVAKEMTREGLKLASKGAKLAVTAATNPKKAEKIAEEMEAIGDRMERLGDSLESMGRDTTFFYEGEDSDAVELSGADLDDFSSYLEEESKQGGLRGFLAGLLGGSFGLLGAIFGITVACIALVLVFGILTMPIWLVALIIWLIVRGTSSRPAPHPVTPMNNGATPADASRTAATTAASGQTVAPTGTATHVAGYVQPYPDENTEMWKSGVMYSCVGVGLIILFCSIGAEDLWGLGALVVCIGVAKLVIASTTKGKLKDTVEPTTETPATPDATEAPAASDNYEK